MQHPTALETFHSSPSELQAPTSAYHSLRTSCLRRVLKCYGTWAGSGPGHVVSQPRIRSRLVCSDLLADRIDFLLG